MQYEYLTAYRYPLFIINNSWDCMPCLSETLSIFKEHNSIKLCAYFKIVLYLLKID